MKTIPIRLVLVLTLMVGLAAPAPVGAVAGYGDVSTSTYYAAPVQWMADENITTGTGPCSFSPFDVVTRGQAAAFIWRMEGRQRPSRSHPFIDVHAGWQQDAVSWLFERGITTGTTSTTYEPDRPVTRGEFAALLHRLAGEPAVPVGFAFGDVSASWQLVPVSWMAREGITTGTTPSTFSPNDGVTRAQAAAFLYRFKNEPRVSVTTEGDCHVLPGDGEWPVPGPVLGRRTLTGRSGNFAVDYDDFGSPWYIHDVDIIADGTHGVGNPEDGPGLMVNSSVRVDNDGDNIKVTSGGVYRNLYLRMAPDGGHIDGMQSQGNTNWVIDNVVIEMITHRGVTGAILIENKVGGGGYADVTGTINRVKIIGTGPYHFDLRLQNSGGRDMTVTITNIDWSDAHPESKLLLTGSPETLTVYVDDTVPPSRIHNAEDATIIRI